MPSNTLSAQITHFVYGIADTLTWEPIYSSFVTVTAFVPHIWLLKAPSGWLLCPFDMPA